MRRPADGWSLSSYHHRPLCISWYTFSVPILEKTLWVDHLIFWFDDEIMCTEEKFLYFGIERWEGEPQRWTIYLKYTQSFIPFSFSNWVIWSFFLSSPLFPSVIDDSTWLRSHLDDDSQDKGSRKWIETFLFPFRQQIAACLRLESHFVRHFWFWVDNDI